ncbi:AMP-binding protein [Nostoc flagelliforme FACHB-838]|uniref:AMP-binding protein n=1 Tax=Nostoc flagelliforme FACHB-838 TaxID=2692904 RepID=A0ABR8DXP9_9NOSO|nr:AMP-binding protein [Nostoc flagelliforme FACHB-838]
MNKSNFELPINCYTFVDLLRCRALQQNEQEGYIFLRGGEIDELHLTYKQLDFQARTIAAQLQNIGASGERALLLYPSGLEFITAFFGCLYAGVIAVPAYPLRRNQKVSRLQAIITDCQAKFLLTTTSELVNLENRLQEKLKLPELCLLATDGLNIDLASNWQQPTSLDSSSLAFLQYTSGSTGMPKGVMVSHSNLLHNSEYIKSAFELTQDSISVTWLPSFHDMGLIDGLLQPLYTGFLGIFMPPASFVQQPMRWLQAISHYRATHSGGPNFGYELCVTKITPEQRESLDLSSWCSAYSGAEPVRRETLDKFAATFKACGFQANFFYPCYGMAEATLMISGGGVTDEPVYYTVEAEALEKKRLVQVSNDTTRVRHLVGCGHAWLDTKIVIADPQSLTSCDTDRVGEIWVSGLSVTQGYWNRLDLTKQTFNAYLADTGNGPFLRTGDLGFFRNGQLFITGRLKDVIIIRGCNHYPQDIELTVEQSHSALQFGCGAAFAIDVEGQERLVIVQEVRRSYLRLLNVNEVIEAIRKAVSEQHELQVYTVLLLKTGSIPKTSSGKIQRYACKAEFLAGSLDVVGHWNANNFSIEASQSNSNLSLESFTDHVFDKISSNEQTNFLENISTPNAQSIQHWIINWLSKTLKINAQFIEPSKSFAEYGVDSQMAVELAQNLKNWLKSPQEIEPTIAWSFPSIESLSDHLANELTSNILVASSLALEVTRTDVKQSVKKLGVFSLEQKIATEVEQLSEVQVQASIAQELAAIENLLEGIHKKNLKK